MFLELVSFLSISFVIAITPGPSVVYVISYSLRYGPKAGVISTIGINVGSVFFILIAAFGLSSLLEIYPTAISIVQLVGSMYIIYLASQMWPRGDAINNIDGQHLSGDGYKKLFVNGVVTSFLNPKDILFYTAFIPTFIPNNVVGKSYQTYFMMLAFSYMAIGFLTKSGIAIFSGYSKQALHSKYAVLVNYLSSIILASLGVFLLVKSVYKLYLP